MDSSGSVENEAAVVDWKIHYTVLNSLQWLALIFAFVIPKNNRNHKVFYLLILMLIVNLIWIVIKKIIHMPSSNMMYFDFIFNSLSIGLAFLFLTAHRFRNSHGLIRFFICIASMIFVVVLGISSTFSKIDRTACEVLVLCVFISVAIPISFFGAAKLIKNRYRPVVFMLLLALFLLVLSIIFMIGYVVIGAIYSKVIPPIVPTLLQVLMIGSVLSLIIYFINLPFLIVGFTVPFYKERFLSLLRLKTVFESQALPSN